MDSVPVGGDVHLFVTKFLESNGFGPLGNGTAQAEPRGLSEFLPELAKVLKRRKKWIHSVIFFLKRLKYVRSVTLNTLEPVASTLVR